LLRAAAETPIPGFVARVDEFVQNALRLST
jgi:hypothetical protein